MFFHRKKSLIAVVLYTIIATTVGVPIWYLITKAAT